jgi:hypothetical protein
MYQLKKIAILLCFSFVFFFSMLIGVKKTCYAIEADNYSYDKVYKALPKKYKSEDYIYEKDNLAYIRFAKVNGVNYTTTVKKKGSSNNYIYCVDYSKKFVFDKSYTAANKMFSDNLRSRIGLAMFYGAQSWGKLANSDFTTGNSVLDYYMTQVVVHSLIYKYGGDKSTYGIKFSDFDFYSDASELKKKAKALYNFCCNASIKSTNGLFQNPTFKISSTTDSTTLTLQDNVLVSPQLERHANCDNGDVESYDLDFSAKDFKDSAISIVSDDDTYNSPFYVEVNTGALDNLSPGKYSLSVSENVSFKEYVAGFWNCSDKKITSTAQELGGLIRSSVNVSDSIDFDFLIGEVSVHKTDSITGEVIDDATFELLQMNDTTGEYVSYKKLSYNSSTQLYECGNIYVNATNKNAMFKIIETSSGANHINDWEGQIFQLKQNLFTYQFDVENQPIMGKLELEKKAIYPAFSEGKFVFQEEKPLGNVKFSLYAAEDIRVKGQLLYKADDKILDFTTDTNGMGTVENLPSGKYYVKEEKTGDLYTLDTNTYQFEITKDDKDKYSQAKLNITNECKQCQVQLFKYYSDEDGELPTKKIPLENAKFGIYAAKDIMNAAGECIVAKDTLIQEGITNQEGLLTFDNLLYADYYIRELEAPTNFLLNEDIIIVSCKDFENDAPNTESQQLIAYKECSNQKKLFQFKLIKYGETFSDAVKEESENGEYYTYSITEQELSNIKFSLYDSNGKLISSKITDANGLINICNIEAGEYYYVEENAPGEYIRSNGKHTFIIKDSDYFKLLEDNFDEDETIDVEDSKNGYSLQPVIKTEEHNQLFSTHLTINKLGEAVVSEKDGFSYKNIPLKDVVFGIYQNFDYAISDNKIISKDSCVGYLVTDSEGNASFQGKIPSGQYYLKELKSNAGYAIDEQLYYFNISPENNDYTVTLDNNNVFTNKLLKASVKIVKTDSDSGKPLKNVEFTLYNDQNDKMGVYKTDKKGIIQVNNLPYGKYYFIETRCRNGYYSTNNKYHFSLTSDDTVVLNITNQPILKLGFNEHYKVGLFFVSIAIVLFIIIILLQQRCRLKRKESSHEQE